MNDSCQIPSLDASRIGASGMPPAEFSDSVFVADEAPGVLDTPHRVTATGQTVTVCIATTRYVGTVDDEGFLVNPDQHIEQQTLVPTLLLTIRAKIGAVDFGGTLGLDGLDVEVFLHHGTAHQEPLGRLVGTFGPSWQDYELDVNVRHVKFPTDPCPDRGASLCATDIEPAANEVTFQFVGTAFPITIEVDWLTLEPKDGPELASRPVLLVHGLGVSSASWQPGTAWVDGLLGRDVPFFAPDLPPTGPIVDNGPVVTLAVQDMKSRFGVDRIHIVGHSKGGLDARHHVMHHDDVDSLIMLGAPNDGSFIANTGTAPAALSGNLFLKGAVYAKGYVEMTTSNLRRFNQSYVPRSTTTYVAAAADYDSLWARGWQAMVGPNDEIVAVSSVQSLSYAIPRTYVTSVNDPESLGVCRDLTNHSCLRFQSRIFDDVFGSFMALQPATGPVLPLVAPVTAADVQQDAGPSPVGLFSAAGLVTGGTTNAHPGVVDAVNEVFFLVFGGPEVSLELVTPSGGRIDATTPESDSAVIATLGRDDGSLSYAGFHIDHPEPGSWTLEVTGTNVTPPEGSSYGVTALSPLVPGTGVSLSARTDQDSYLVGDPITTTATLAEDGTAITGATVSAVVIHPDGLTSTEVALRDEGTDGDAAAGDGTYSGLLTGDLQPGRYIIAVSAGRAEPAFAREQVLEAVIAQRTATFSGTITDHGSDVDGDGQFDELVVDVELDVDAAGTYRLFGTLTDGAGTIVEQVDVEQALEPGVRIASLRFDGAALFQLGHDGSYLVTDLVLEDAATNTGLTASPPYLTGVYAHTDFQRPAILLTGNVNDQGVNFSTRPQLPFEELLIEVEVDLAVGADLEAGVQLYSDDGGFVASDQTFTDLPAGTSMLQFRVPASSIFRTGKSGPYTVRLLSISGTGNDGAAFSLRVPDTVAITQPYPVEQFAESPRFTVGGTVTGLVGTGLELEEHVSRPLSPTIRPRANGPFEFIFPTLFSGNSYDVRVVRQPSNPAQICTVSNGAGTVGDADITNVLVTCVTGAEPDQAIPPTPS